MSIAAGPATAGAGGAARDHDRDREAARVGRLAQRRVGGFGDGDEPRVRLAEHAELDAPRLLVLDADRVRGSRLPVHADAGGLLQIGAGAVLHDLEHAGQDRPHLGRIVDDHAVLAFRLQIEGRRAAAIDAAGADGGRDTRALRHAHQRRRLAKGGGGQVAAPLLARIPVRAAPPVLDAGIAQRLQPFRPQRQAELPEVDVAAHADGVREVHVAVDGVPGEVVDRLVPSAC